MTILLDLRPREPVPDDCDLVVVVVGDMMAMAMAMVGDEVVVEW